jgi:NAD(P)-dependent dehydrogenase (short-subunit alcohol dehydrogenase family)
LIERLSLEDPLAAFRLDGRIAAITGAGSGLGRAIAQAFARVGAEVALLDRNGATAAEVAEQIRAAGGRAHSLVLDVSDAAEVDRVFTEIGQRLGGLDVLVNSAGIAIRKATVETSREDWDTVMSVNVTGSFLCARAAARLMLPKRRGSMINLASIMGFSGGLYPNSSYQTSKGAIVNMTRALALEWAKDGIRVNAVAPTWTRTEFTRTLLARPDALALIEAATPMGRVAEPEEIVGAVLFLASPAASMVTGHTLAVDGGFLAR